MKKVFILIVLFALPVSVYILFATAAHNFVHLPVKTKNITEPTNFHSLRGDTISFKHVVTVLCFFGKNIEAMQGNAFNLNEKIYRKNHIYKDFQIVVLAKNGTQDQAKNLMAQLHQFSGLNMYKWKFDFGTDQAIKQVFNSLHTDLTLTPNLSSPFVFLIDKEGNLRGQKDNDRVTTKTLFGYDTRSVAALTNGMVDDLKVLLAEYRLKYKEKKMDIIKHTDKQ